MPRIAVMGTLNEQAMRHDATEAADSDLETSESRAPDSALLGSKSRGSGIRSRRSPAPEAEADERPTLPDIPPLDSMPPGFPYNALDRLGQPAPFDLSTTADLPSAPRDTIPAPPFCEEEPEGSSGN